MKNKFYHLSASCLTKLLIMLFISLFSVNLNAQIIFELSDYMGYMKKSTEFSDKSSAALLVSLVNEIQPTVYISKNGIVNRNGKPVSIIVRDGLINKINISDPLLQDIEIITIILRNSNETGFKFDLTNLSGFVHLRYVYFLFEFNCLSEDIRKLFVPKDGITVLYKVSIPS